MFPQYLNSVLKLFLLFLDSLNIIKDLTTKYGPVTRTWLGHKLIIAIRKPELLEAILTSPKYITKGSLYDFLEIWLGRGLLLSTGSKWHSRRKIITPTFHFKILEEFVEIFDRQSKILAQKLEKHLDGKEFNVYPYVTLAALDVVCGKYSYIYFGFSKRSFNPFYYTCRNRYGYEN